MNICNNRHEEIVYEGNPCPLCIMLEEKAELEQRIDELEEDLGHFTDE